MLEEKLCWKGERGLLRIGYLQLLTGTPVSCEHSNIKCFGGGLPRGASPVAQWLRIRLPMQGTQVQALVREDPTCRGASKPVRRDY